MKTKVIDYSPVETPRNVFAHEFVTEMNCHLDALPGNHCRGVEFFDGGEKVVVSIQKPFAWFKNIEVAGIEGLFSHHSNTRGAVQQEIVKALAEVQS
jgi:hypothetical protein